MADLRRITDTEPLWDKHIPRHGGHGGPLIFPEGTDPVAYMNWLETKNPKDRPDGGKYYSRTTNFIDVLDDKGNLSKWGNRMVLHGVHLEESLLREYAELEDPLNLDKGLAQVIADKAKTIAGAEDKAEQGTALHEVTEDIDNGLDPGFIPPEYEDDIREYKKQTAELEMLRTEIFCVQDTLKVAGTYDRLIRRKDGRVQVGDLKTYGTLNYAYGKTVMQLACYAHMSPYAPWEGSFDREPLMWDGVEVDQDEALMIWMPNGAGRCEVIPIDIRKGWEDVLLASRVKEYRNYWNRKANRQAPIYATA